MKKLRVLIACEFSGTVRDAFIAKGHDAWSCDLLPTDKPGPHIQGDVLEVVFLPKWDLVIAHPPCTYLTVTANKWLKDQPKRKSGALVGEARREARREAVEFFMLFTKLNCKWAIENPIGIMSTEFKKPDQIIQPFQFGHQERKATCLWLKNLPILNPTNIVDPISYIANGKRYSPTHYNSKRSLNRLDCLPPGIERSKLRSKTYNGIANAMADQWSLN